MNSENIVNEFSDNRSARLLVDANTGADQDLVSRKRVSFSTPKMKAEKSLNFAESVKKSKGDQTHRQDCTAESSQFSIKEHLYDECNSSPFGIELKNSAQPADQTFKLKKDSDMQQNVNDEVNCNKTNRLPTKSLEIAMMRASHSL